MENMRKKPLPCLRQKLSNLPLKRKFIVVFCSMLLVCCTVILCAAFFVFHQYENELYKNTSQILNMAIDTMESDLEAIEQAGTWTISNAAVQKVLNDPDIVFDTREPVLLFGQASQQIYEALSYYYSRNDSVLSASIYVGNERFCVGADTGEEPAEALANARQAAQAAGGRAVWLSAGREDNSLYYTREIRDIQNMTLRPVGLLLLRVDLRGVIEKRLKTGPNLNYQPQITILDQNDGVLFSDLDLTQRREDVFPNQNGYRKASLGGQDYFISYAIRSRFHLRYALYLPIGAVAASLRLLNIAVLFIGVLTVVVCMFFCSRLVGQIVRHFDVLVRKMRLFREGKLREIRGSADSRRQDELGYLHRSFDEMVEDFNRLVEDNYVKQLAIKDAHIKSLQNQINPHFLFNILQTIHWKARAGQQEDISHITEALGKLLRYTLGEQQELVGLEKELEVTRYYVSMQKYRYGKRLEVEILVPACYSGVRVPPMAVQNLVENAIKHALENMLEPCRIEVGIYREESFLALFVEDNGPGIDEHLLDGGDVGESRKGMGIGLKNIGQRLSLLLGEQYGVRLRNTGHGARVELLLPLPEGEAKTLPQPFQAEE